MFPSFAIGGVPLRIAAIINRLGPRFRHTIVSLDGRFDSSRDLDPGATVTLIPFDRPGRGGLPVLLTAIRRRLSRFRPDLLLTYNWGATDWAMANRLLPACRHVHFESGFGPEEADHQIRRRVLYRRSALARASQVVVPSHTLQQIATGVWKIPGTRVRLIPNGVDLVRFQADPGDVERGPFPKEAGEVVIGTVAPLRAEKALDRMIRAFAAVVGQAPARLVIVGDGAERPRLETLSRELGLAERVVFAGHLDAVERAYRWFDIFAMSSDTEQMPNVLIQAMAAGRPVAATDVGDVRRIVAPENRELIVPREDEAGYAAALASLVADGGRRRQLGRCNRDQVRRHYDLNDMVRAYERIFSS